MSSALPAELRRWLRAHADALDGNEANPEELLPKLASYDSFRVGVPESLGGLGGDIGDAVERLAETAEESLTAAFVFWSQRTFIEYLIRSPNTTLREQTLQSLLTGRLAGASGLSNAMKFLSGIEELQARVVESGSSFGLEGKAPWVTNLRRSGFLVAIAAESPDGAPPWVLSVASQLEGVVRSNDLRLLSLGSSNTAALRFQGARVRAEDILHRDARAFIDEVRPAFLGLQCGLAIGLARASLRVAEEFVQARSRSLAARLQDLSMQLEGAVDTLRSGLAARRFVADAPALFSLRIQLATIAQAAVELELRASGGSAYLRDIDRGFARRWREAAFIPIVTPSLVQLEHELQRRSSEAAA